jgi:hypothetical protein
MTDIIAKVTERGPRGSLDRILTLLLALDIWETRPDHVVLRASEQHLDLLAQMNYGVEQIETTNRFLITHDALRVPEATARPLTETRASSSTTTASPPISRTFSPTTGTTSPGTTTSRSPLCPASPPPENRRRPARAASVGAITTVIERHDHVIL